jgi:lysophospholipid acyltransferase (LPLAT)-like uncharacterized protein
MFRNHLLPWLVWWLYRLWTWSWRVSLKEPGALNSLLQQGQPVIFAHWHGDELAITHLVTKFRIATMTSTSKDGNLIDFVIRRLGGATSRGSATRGAVGALKGLIVLMRNGFNASMAVDGPKGPIHQVKPGVFELSRLAKAHIVPTAAACSAGIIFEKSWNKACLPKPFSRVTVVFGEPIPVISRDDDVRSEKLAADLGKRLSDARHQAAKLIAEA